LPEILEIIKISIIFLHFHITTFKCTLT